jgi:hypothetical protein
LPQLLSSIGEAASIVDFTGLAHHVLGEHLNAWTEGLALLARAAALPTFEMTGPSGQTVKRAQASLRLCEGSSDERAGLSSSDAIRVGVMAAVNLGRESTARAAGLLQEVLTGIEAASAAGLSTSDPAHRAVAANCNNLAANLADLPQRTDEQRALMLHAAQVARVHWAIAGTWLETERADYRLSLCWLKAGDATQALRHAKACLAVVEANGAVPLEQFFAAEAWALAAHVADDTTSFAAAMVLARTAFGGISADDRDWCQATLDQLNALPAALPTLGGHGTSGAV